MAQLFQQHTKRQRKCRLVTKLPLTFRAPIPPARRFQLLHRQLAGAATVDTDIHPPIAHCVRRADAHAYN
ncbi:MAG: hypothetical protein WBA63_05215 [Thermomicrobiales bacterium]